MSKSLESLPSPKQWVVFVHVAGLLKTGKKFLLVTPAKTYAATMIEDGRLRVTSQVTDLYQTQGREIVSIERD